MSNQPGSCSGQHEAKNRLTQWVLAEIAVLFAASAIYPNAIQQQMLVVHVGAMAQRALTGEALPDLEASLFDEISPSSLALAQRVVDLFGNLPVEESWLLSVHVEVARKNDDQFRSVV